MATMVEFKAPMLLVTMGTIVKQVKCLEFHISTTITDNLFRIM
jgi:hypothetical protein